MSERFYNSNVVAKRLGVPVVTLRFWAREGLIPAGRTLGGRRYLWNDDQIREIAEMIADGQVPEDEECHVQA